MSSTATATATATAIGSSAVFIGAGTRDCRLPSSSSLKSVSLTPRRRRNLAVRAQYNSSNDRAGGGADFVAGFLVGGAIFGALAYVFAPQIRKSMLNEDEYGFRRAKRPIYYDEGLEKTRQTLNEKISQLNSAIDNVSSRLKGGSNTPSVPVEADPEEATT